MKLSMVNIHKPLYLNKEIPIINTDQKVNNPSQGTTTNLLDDFNAIFGPSTTTEILQ